MCIRDSPKAFDPAAFAAQKFPEIKSTVVTKAVDLKDLAPAVTADVKAAGAKYCTDAGSGKYDCPVKVTGAVKSVDENWLILDTPDIAGWTVRVPVGPALSGNALRDAVSYTHLDVYKRQVQDCLRRLDVAD